MSAHTERRPIPGFDGYEADAEGHVWSVGSNWRGKGERSERRLEFDFDQYGYPRVRVNKPGGKRTPKKVHTLVALAFFGPKPSPLHQVRHLDGNPLNNAVENLAWGTALENANDRESHGRTSRGVRHSRKVVLGQSLKASDRLISAAPDLLAALKMMNGHTPGPWKMVVETRPHGDPSYYVTAADPDASKGSGHLEVPFHIGLAGGNQRTLASGRTMANARLISAAPDLLEALKALLVPLEGAIDTTGLVDAARTAIAKAEGK